MQLLKELITINKNFQTAVNLRLDREDADKFMGYIPTASSVALLKQFLRNVLERRGKSAAILTGPYGKGKSHLLLVLLALLEKQFPHIRKRALEKVGEIDQDCAKAAEKAIEKGPFLTVLVSENGTSINTAFLLALKESLKRKGLEELMPDSYFGEAEKCIGRWEKDFPETYRQLGRLLREYAQYAGREAGNPVKIMQRELSAYSEDAMKLFQTLYPQLTAGTSFSPLINMEAPLLYQEVNRRLCRDYGYQGIYVVFDEFSKYLEGHSGAGFGADMKVLQDMCELANASQEEAFFITFVAHKSLREYNSRIPKELQNQFRGIEGRIQEYLFVASARNNFDLIGSVLQKTEKFKKEFRGFFRQQHVEEFNRKAYELPAFRTQFSWDEYEKTVVEGCFPLTPMAALLLLNLSEKAAQNERTLFTFLAGDEPGSLYRLVYGRKESSAQFFDATAIYDYFTPVLRGMTDFPDIHNEWLKADYALKQVEHETDRRLIKAAAILCIAGNRQEMPANCRNIALAAGTSEKQAEEHILVLVNRDLLIWRSKLGCYAFKNNVGVNLEEELQAVIHKQPARLDIPTQLAAVSEMEYMLPKSYNQTYSITRYFQYVYMTPEVLAQTWDTAYLFEEKFSDGKLIALISEKEIDLTEVLERSRAWNDSRVLILLPNRTFGQENAVRRLLAALELLEDKIFLEDNKVLVQELKLCVEDMIFEINAALEEDFLPRNQVCRVIWKGAVKHFATEMQLNAFLSEICGAYYNFSPKVNHELLNIRNVTGQYLKARNHVVEKLLLENSMEEYEKGTGPEAMVYRTAFVRTGLRSGRFPADAGTLRLLEEIHRFILSCTDRKLCFDLLYERLQGKEFGVRKGVMPLFLASELAAVAGTPVLYLQTKEVGSNAEILNNINERPEQYFLYLEGQDGEKEAYLEALEIFFGIVRSNGGKQERMRRLALEMQRKYRALPKVVSNWKQFDETHWKRVIGDFQEGQEEGWQAQDAGKLYEVSEKLIGILRKMDVNPRELLFDKIPYFLGRSKSDEMCARAVKIIFTCWMQRLQNIKAVLAEECLGLWGGGQGESLAAYLKDWYRKRRDSTKNMVLGSGANSLRACLESIEAYNDQEVAADLAFALSDVHIEDWTEETREVFLKTLTEAKAEIENCARADVKIQNSKKVVFTDREGRLIERYFRPEDSGIGNFLKNAINEALEEFGDSMEPAQKAAVLMEALEELLK